jgi:acyl-CoA thioester hydrolase
MMRPESPAQSSPPVSIPHVTSVRVTYRMTDQMGVVYYGNYMELFEIGRTELLRATGLTYRHMESDGFFLPVVHVACDFLMPARYDDLLLIHTRIGRISRIRIDFAYEVLRAADQALLCRGLSHHAIVGSNGRPRRLNAGWLGRLGYLGKE